MANSTPQKLQIRNNSSESGTVFSVTKDALKLSDVLDSLLGDMFDDMDVPDDTELPIFLHGVSDVALHRVFAWMEWQVLLTAETKVKEQIRAEAKAKKEAEAEAKKQAEENPEAENPKEEAKPQGSEATVAAQKLKTAFFAELKIARKTNLEATQPISDLTDAPLLFEICNAANYLAIEGLLDATTGIIARLISDMSTQQMREFFGYKEEDLSEAEKEELAAETRWADDRESTKMW